MKEIIVRMHLSKTTINLKLFYLECEDEYGEPVVEPEHLDELDGAHEQDAADHVAVELVDHANISVFYVYVIKYYLLFAIVVFVLKLDVSVSVSLDKDVQDLHSQDVAVDVQPYGYKGLKSVQIVIKWPLEVYRTFVISSEIYKLRSLVNRGDISFHHNSNEVKI